MAIEIIELTTTTETEQQAQQIAQLLINNRMAACVQISGPIQSLYRWQGSICESHEFRLTIKTSTRLAADLVEFLSANHPYTTPEILVNRLEASDVYGMWVEEQTCEES
jgi:periplasmic divalent cation tolerance protein